MSLAQRLAAYATKLTFDQLDSNSIHEVCRRLIDSLGCACGAYQAQPVAIGRRLATRIRYLTETSNTGAYFLGGSSRTSPEMAAFVNGIAFRYLDYNDTYLSKEPAHPSDNLAAILAAADISDATGQAIITATVLAYEIQCRLCDAASIRARGWDHVTYGAISTSAAASQILRLTEDQIAQAINLAGTPNVTLRQTRAGELSEWKGCAFANASRNGIFAALLAAEGLTGPAPLFEGELGFFKQVSGPFSLPPFGGEPAADGFIINRTSIKYWPAEYHSQSAIQAAIELHGQIDDPQLIDRVDIYSFDAAVDIIGKDPEKWAPKTRETADHSLPYCTVAALLDGDITLATFEEPRLHDPRLLSLISRTTIHRDAQLTIRYPRGIPNRVVVTFKDGRQIIAENEFPCGHDQNPMNDEHVSDKFHRLAEGVLSPAQQQRVLDLCWNLPTLPNLNELWRHFPAI